MKTITIHNKKGGTGKTTITGSLAQIMSQSHKILLLDTDTQANLSNWLLKNHNITHDLGDLLYQTTNIKNAIQKITPTLHIIPLLSLDSHYQNFIENELTRQPFAFTDIKEQINNLNYDYLLIDTPPQSSILIDSIFAIIDETLIVINGDTFSIDGLEIMQNYFQNIKKTRKNNFTHNKIIFNKFNKSMALHNGYLESIKQLKQFTTYTIKQYQNFANAIAKNTILTKTENIPPLIKLAKDIAK